MKNTTLVMVSCFSGAPWDLSQMTELTDWPMKTMKLPDDLNNLKDLADFVTAEGTGHMFRFSHPALYSRHIKEFLAKTAMQRLK